MPGGLTIARTCSDNSNGTGSSKAHRFELVLGIFMSYRKFPYENYVAKPTNNAITMISSLFECDRRQLGCCGSRHWFPWRRFRFNRLLNTYSWVVYVKLVYRENLLYVIVHCVFLYWVFLYWLRGGQRIRSVGFHWFAQERAKIRIFLPFINFSATNPLQHDSKCGAHRLILFIVIFHVTNSFAHLAFFRFLLRKTMSVHICGPSLAIQVPSHSPKD